MFIKTIVIEEIKRFMNENWFNDDEPSIADKIYDKRGITLPPENKEITGELVGILTHSTITKKPFNNPIKIYKNPKNLKGFGDDVRGVLTNAIDLYLATSYAALHDDILSFLSDNKKVDKMSTFGYADRFPDEFIAVQRMGSSNTFIPSTLYETFPNKYVEMFDEASYVNTFDFKPILS